MDNLAESLSPTQVLNNQSLKNIFGNEANIVFQEDGKYQVTTLLTDSIIEGGQQMGCQIHREIVTIDVEGAPRTGMAWVLDSLSVNNELLVSGQDIKILISDDPYHNEEFQATIANLELQSLYQANTDDRQIYVQSQINSMDSVVSLMHEITHFDTIAGFTDQQVELMKNYGKFKYQIDLLLYQHIEDQGVIPEISECEELRAKFSKELLATMSEAEIDNLKTGSQLVFLNETKTNQETLVSVSSTMEKLFPSDPQGYRLKKYLTTVNLSYARTINGLFGGGTVETNQAELR